MSISLFFVKYLGDAVLVAFVGCKVSGLAMTRYSSRLI
jgi:hypothetical protein